MRQDDDEFIPPSEEDHIFDAYEANHTAEGLLELLQDPANQADEERFTRVFRFGQDFLYVTHSEIADWIGCHLTTIDRRLMSRKGFSKEEKEKIVQLYLSKLTAAMKLGKVEDCKGRPPIRRKPVV